MGAGEAGELDGTNEWAAFYLEGVRRAGASRDRLAELRDRLVELIMRHPDSVASLLRASRELARTTPAEAGRQVADTVQDVLSTFDRQWGLTEAMGSVREGDVIRSEESGFAGDWSEAGDETAGEGAE
jgi:hypothetical protein